MLSIPEEFLDLLKRPLIGHLAMVRTDGTVASTPMWYEWDGEYLRFTTSTQRMKTRNAASNPAIALSIVDPEQPYRYLEIRGKVTDIQPDPDGAFYARLAERYGISMDGKKIGDAEYRVVMVVEPTASSRHRPVKTVSSQN